MQLPKRPGTVDIILILIYHNTWAILLGTAAWRYTKPQFSADRFQIVNNLYVLWALAIEVVTEMLIAIIAAWNIVIEPCNAILPCFFFSKLIT